jgi:hypothetical protein
MMAVVRTFCSVVGLMTLANGPLELVLWNFVRRYVGNKHVCILGAWMPQSVEWLGIIATLIQSETLLRCGTKLDIVLSRLSPARWRCLLTDNVCVLWIKRLFIFQKTDTLHRKTKTKPNSGVFNSFVRDNAVDVWRRPNTTKNLSYLHILAASVFS